VTPARPRYLRLSVTSRCNLRCLYCRSGEDDPVAETSADPTVEELRFLVECAAEEGVEKIRLTGGEPLLREELEEIVHAVNGVAGVRETLLTTNGLGLETRARALRAAGLTRVNVSLDSLRRETYLRITGGDRIEAARRGIAAAVAVFDEVKINAVLLRGINDDEIESLVRFAAGDGMEIRFIERYGFGGVAERTAETVTVEEVRNVLERAFGPLRPVENAPLSVAERFELPLLLNARVGLIAAASHPPCAACEKLRFTAEGTLQSCLFAPAGVDLRPLLAQRDAPAVRRAVRECFAAKCRGGPGLHPAARSPIHRIGG
jgi:cyclic pyranopterin phosphate synthase